MYLLSNTRDTPGKLSIVWDNPLRSIIPPQHLVTPAVVNIDVFIPEVLKAQRDEQRRHLDEHILADAAFILVS